MRKGRALLLSLVCLFALLRVARTQQTPDSQQSPPTLTPPPTLKPGPTQKPPTLGAPPSAAGPHAGNTENAHRLLQVHAVFIERMDNGLAEKLIDEIGKKGVFKIVAERKQADAILHGSCFDSTRLKTVHSEVFLSGLGGESIWQDSVHQAFKPPPLDQAISTTAQAIAEDLATSIRLAREE